VFPARLALGTKNPGKVGEILAICSGWPVEWVTFREASWPDIAEAGESYLENARLKARAVAGAVGLPALAEDSGIEVDALGGGPGIRSARFAGDGATDQQNLELLIERIRFFPPERRTARYRCVAVCVWPGGDETSGEGTCEGRLILEPRGAGGFGYDPVFVPGGSDLTMAELGPEAKNAISHRGTALHALGAVLERA
jgi:XTP/dITP diphosphohydrolase